MDKPVIAGVYSHVRGLARIYPEKYQIAGTGVLAFNGETGGVEAVGLPGQVQAQIPLEHTANEAGAVPSFRGDTAIPVRFADMFRGAGEQFHGVLAVKRPGRAIVFRVFDRAGTSGD